MNRFYRISSFLILGFSVPVSLSSMAAIDINKVEVFNASQWERPSATSTNPTTGAPVETNGNLKVYGGIAGDLTTGTCPSITDTTCNNCGPNNLPCNAARITPTSYLRFEFQTDNASVLTTSSTFYIKTDTKAITIPAQNRSSELAINTTLYIQILWSELCGELTGQSDCLTGTSGVKNLQVGISAASDGTLDEYFNVDLAIAGSNSPQLQYTSKCPPGGELLDSFAGFCWVEIQRGDQKIYLHNESHIETYPLVSGGVDFKYLRVFYAQDSNPCTGGDDIAARVNSGSKFKDFTLHENADKTFSVNEPTITDLENDKLYYFMFGNVDLAGNVFYFSGAATSLAPEKQLLNCTQHTAIPSEVVGLLDGKDCFIATAAFGSPLAPQLDILREFRNRFMLTNKIGRWLVTQYYTYSPRWAQKLKKRPAARAVVRATLSPVISMAQWVILYGLRSFILISAIGFCLGFLIIRRLIQDHD